MFESRVHASHASCLGPSAFEHEALQRGEGCHLRGMNGQSFANRCLQTSQIPRHDSYNKRIANAPGAIQNVYGVCLVRSRRR